MTPTDFTGRNTAKAWLVFSYHPAGAQLVDEDGVGAAQQVGKFGLHFAEDAHAEAGAGEGVAIDHVVRQAERDAEFAYFVLEQFAQRFEQLEVQLFGQAADVVMALDGMRLLGLRAGRFDHVGVDRALRQPFGVAELGGLGLEHLDELATDDLALLLRVGDALQVAHELRVASTCTTLTPRLRAKVCITCSASLRRSSRYRRRRR
jgi:hypothetical protein